MLPPSLIGRGSEKLGPIAWLVVIGSVAALTLVLVLGLGDKESAGVIRVVWATPIAIAAMQFGQRGGLAAAVGALALLVSYEAASTEQVSIAGALATAAAYLAVGGLLGRLVDERNGLEMGIERQHALALDLMAIATFDGYLEEVNPAWERTLGFTAEELRGRPVIDLIHPDDREMSLAEAERLTRGEKTVSFRNRYLTADGGYRWLEWNIQPDPAAQKLDGSARDITAQKEAETELKNQHERLEIIVQERTRSLEESRLEVLQRLALAAEYRDDDTHQHTERVGRTAARIARGLGFSDEDVKLIRLAAPLHDIGKVGVPDAVLLKRGDLTEEEYRAMQEHVRIGANILANGKFPILSLARTIALSHHERWDGSGYPYGLVGDRIPIVGQITAVADVFDALTHERPYKPAWSIEDSVAEIRKNSGIHFDPSVVDAFLELDHVRLLHPVGRLRPANWGAPKESPRALATA